MEKIWLKSYPPGVPAEIDPSRYYVGFQICSTRVFANIARGRLSSAWVSRLPTANWMRCRSKLAAWLQSKGLARGARVAIMMPNVLQYPVAIAAILRAGYVVVNVNPLYTPRELEHQLKDSGAEAIILLENFAVTLQAVVRNTAVKHIVVAAMGDLMGTKGLIVNFVVRHVKKMVPAWNLPGHIRFNAAVADGARREFTPVKQEPDDIAFLQYTGGTTGVAKGATLAASESDCQCVAVGGLARPGARGASRYRTVRDCCGAAALSHICTDSLWPVDHPYGRPGRADSEPARYRRHDQGAARLCDHDTFPR